MRQLLFLTSCLILALIAGYSVAQFSPKYLVLGTTALLIFLLTFQNVEFGLLVLAFSMLLSPEFIVGTTEGSSLGRGVTLRFDDFILVIIGLSWFARNAIDKDIGLILKTPLNRPIFFYAAACAISTGWGIVTGRVEPKTGFFYVLKYLEYFVVFFMVINHINDTKQINRLLACLLLTCFIVSIVGVMQIPGGGRITAPFEGTEGEPNTLGGYLVFMLAIIGGLLLYTDRPGLRQLLLLVLLPLIPSLLFTQSRASYLAAIPALFALAWFSQKRVIMTGLMVIGLIVIPLFLPSAVTERVSYTFTQRQQQGQLLLGDIRLDTSTSARLISWREAIVDWTNHPIFGYGVSGYHFVDAQFPRVLVETGLIGLAAFTFLLHAVFSMGITALKSARSPTYRGLCAGYLAGSLALLFHALGANTFIIVRIMEPFWFLTGIVFIAGGLDQHTTPDEAPAADEATLASRLRA